MQDSTSVRRRVWAAGVMVAGTGVRVRRRV